MRTIWKITRYQRHPEPYELREVQSCREQGAFREQLPARLLRAVRRDDRVPPTDKANLTCIRAAEKRCRRQDWRRGRDSNPRYGCPYFAFRVRRIRPLCHLSARGRANWPDGQRRNIMGMAPCSSAMGRFVGFGGHERRFYCLRALRRCAVTSISCANEDAWRSLAMRPRESCSGAEAGLIAARSPVPASSCSTGRAGPAGSQRRPSACLPSSDRCRIPASAPFQARQDHARRGRSPHSCAR